MMKRRAPLWTSVFWFSLLATLAVWLVACSEPKRPDGGEGLLPVGASAPDLVGQDQDGNVQRISAERGRPLVVYFYPKDGTPGCTAEACAFRDVWDKYKAVNAQVFGVSADTREAHADFAKEHGLPFPLITDPEFNWATAFGVDSKLGMMNRVTFLIGPEGKVAKVYPEVDPGVHAEAILKDIAALGPAGTAPAAEQPPAAAPAAAPAPPAAAPAAPAEAASAAPAAAAPAATPPK